MKEVHIGPLNIEGEFHIGRITEVLVADLYTRWQLFSGKQGEISLVHNSWNTFGRETATIDLNPNRGIDEQRKLKDELLLLPSGDIYGINDNFEVGLPQEFRDDDPKTEKIVNDALRILLRTGIVVPGIVEGERGLYFDIPKVISRKNIIPTISETFIFPARVKNVFLKAIDPENKSNYIIKIPITKRRLRGLRVDKKMLESHIGYHYDQRFSPKKIANPDPLSEICVSPLFILAMLPYIRHQQTGGREIDFITNGIGSSLRFNFVSILLGLSLGLEQPYRHIHLFDRLDLPCPTGVGAGSNEKDNALRIRYLVFSQLPLHHKVIEDNFMQCGSCYAEFSIPSLRSLNRKVSILKSALERAGNLSIPTLLRKSEREYLVRIGFSEAMDALNYPKALKTLEKEIAHRTREIGSGTSQNDPILLGAINLFLPGVI